MDRHEAGHQHCRREDMATEILACEVQPSFAVPVAVEDVAQQREVLAPDHSRCFANCSRNSADSTAMAIEARCEGREQPLTGNANVGLQVGKNELATAEFATCESTEQHAGPLLSQHPRGERLRFADDAATNQPVNGRGSDMACASSQACAGTSLESVTVADLRGDVSVAAVAGEPAAKHHFYERPASPDESAKDEPISGTPVHRSNDMCGVADISKDIALQSFSTMREIGDDHAILTAEIFRTELQRQLEQLWEKIVSSFKANNNHVARIPSKNTAYSEAGSPIHKGPSEGSASVRSDSQTFNASPKSLASQCNKHPASAAPRSPASELVEAGAEEAPYNSESSRDPRDERPSSARRTHPEAAGEQRRRSFDSSSDAYCSESQKNVQRWATPNWPTLQSAKSSDSVSKFKFRRGATRVATAAKSKERANFSIVPEAEVSPHDSDEEVCPGAASSNQYAVSAAWQDDKVEDGGCDSMHTNQCLKKDGAHAVSSSSVDLGSTFLPSNVTSAIAAAADALQAVQEDLGMDHLGDKLMHEFGIGENDSDGGDAAGHEESARQLYRHMPCSMLEAIEAGSQKKNVLLPILFSRGFYIIRLLVEFLNLFALFFVADIRLNLAVSPPMEEAALRETCDKESLLFRMESSCYIFFALELALRAYAEGRYFLASHSLRAWNIMDVCILLVSLPHFITRFVFGQVWFINITFLRALRVLVNVYLARSTRLQQVTATIRLILGIISGSVPALMSILLSLGLVVLAWSLGLACIVTIRVRESRAKEFDLTYFGTLGKTFLSLTMAISGGEDWILMWEELGQVHVLCSSVFFLYVFFMVIGVLNIVTGVFVEQAMRVSNSSREAKIKTQQEQEESYVAELSLIFSQADDDNSGIVTWEQFEKHLEDQRILAYLSSLDLDVQDVHALYRLLDTDGSGVVRIEDFGWGCLRLKGYARSLDLCTLLYEHRTLGQKFTVLLETLGHHFKDIDFAPVRRQAPVSTPERRRSITSEPLHTLAEHQPC